MNTWAIDRLKALLSGQAKPPPVVTTLRLGTLDEFGAGWAKKVWRADPALMNGDGSMFGGYLAALADQMLALATMTVLPADKLFRTTNLNVSFYRVSRGDLHIEAKVVSQSKQVIAVRCEFLSDDSTLVAEASAQQMLMSIG